MEFVRPHPQLSLPHNFLNLKVIADPASAVKTSQPPSPTASCSPTYTNQLSCFMNFSLEDQNLKKSTAQIILKFTHFAEMRQQHHTCKTRIKGRSEFLKSNPNYSYFRTPKLLFKFFMFTFFVIRYINYGSNLL